MSERTSCELSASSNDANARGMTHFQPSAKEEEFSQERFNQLSSLPITQAFLVTCRNKRVCIATCNLSERTNQESENAKSGLLVRQLAPSPAQMRLRVRIQVNSADESRS